MTANEISIIEDMTLEEAEMCAVAISSHMESAHKLLLDMDRRRGWKALGYKSLADYFQNRMKISIQEGYRRLGLYAVEENLNSQLDTTEPIALRGRWVVDSQIHQLEPDKQVEAYQLAVQIQNTEGDRRLKGRHMVQAVAQIRAREVVFESPYPLITQMVITGKMSTDDGKEILEALDTLKPVQRGAVLQLIAEHGLTNPELVGPLGSLFGRPADRPSLMLPEVLAGFLGGTPLSKARMSDWRVAAGEARAQHIAEKTAANAPFSQPVIITIYKGDVKRTVAALKEVLGDEVLNIRDMLMRE